MRYDERKAYVFVDDFLQIIGENCCEYYKLSESTVQLALIGLVQLGWSSRWLSGTPEDFHRVSTSAFNIYRASYYERAIRELTMSCDNEIKEGLESLGASILAGFQALANKQSGGCGCEDIPGSGHGSGGAGTNTGNPSTNEGQWNDPEAPPLPGFETKEESDAYQCSMAHKILEEMKGDISTISTLSIVGLVATEIAAVLIPLLFTPLAWVDVVLLCAIVLEAIVLGLSYAEVIEHLEENEDDYICALLSGGDASSSIDNFRSKVEELVPEDEDFPDPVSQYLVTRFINSFATYDSINRLFDKVNYTLPSADCNCSGDCLLNIVNGSLESGELDGSTPSFTVSGEYYATVPPYGDLYRIVINVTTEDGCGCRTFGISQSGQTVLPPEAALYTQIRNCEGDLVQEYEAADFFDGECLKIGQPEDAFFFFTFSSTPFTVTFTWGDEC